MIFKITSVRVVSLSLRLRLITLTSTLIILDITKTSPNKSLLIVPRVTMASWQISIKAHELYNIRNIFCKSNMLYGTNLLVNLTLTILFVNVKSSPSFRVTKELFSGAESSSYCVHLLYDEFKKLTSVFYASALLLIMNFVITLSK